MQLEAKKLLYDVQAAARLIDEFTQERSYEDYSVNSMLRSAVERQFEIIGEALTKLARLDPETAGRIPDHQKIISFRNVLIHGYAIVQDEVVWGILKTKLPPLMTSVEALLGE